MKLLPWFTIRSPQRNPSSSSVCSSLRSLRFDALNSRRVERQVTRWMRGHQWAPVRRRPGCGVRGFRPRGGGTPAERAEPQWPAGEYMARSFYSHIREAWRRPDEGDLAELQWRRQQEWRNQGAVERIDRPTRLDRARSLGYKAKQGIIVVRVSVRKGGARKSRFRAGRRTKRMGVNRITRRKSIQRIAEERAARKFRNLRVLNSYPVGEDGTRKWHEAILIDPEHPAIRTDDDLSWLCEDDQRGRVYRGKTSAGTKGRGQRTKGKGTEHTRPSLRSDRRRGK